MSLRLAARRLARPAAPSSPSPSTLLSSPAPRHQVRHKWSVNLFKSWGKGAAKPAAADSSDPTSAVLDDPKKRQDYIQRNARGTLKGNIFEDEVEAPSQRAGAPTTEQDKDASVLSEAKTKDTMALVTDPDPRARMRWQRKKVIQMVRRNGHLTRDEKIAMTERSLLHKSEFMPTSVKKLVMLARQIAGKPVDEAIAQMKWSKKKFAAEMKYYLEEARDLAVAQRGMGLGSVNGETMNKARNFRTKDGKWVEINDPTRIYIAQSWVGRGAWLGKELDYKGRGRMGIIQHPSTSFTVILKEEKTRIREFEEREAKKAAKGPWVHHPNRPVYGQRPYYSW